MFVDKVEISIKAGNGGNGAVTFHREKYVNAGWWKRQRYRFCR